MLGFRQAGDPPVVSNTFWIATIAMVASIPILVTCIVFNTAIGTIGAMIGEIAGWMLLGGYLVSLSCIVIMAFYDTHDEGSD